MPLCASIGEEIHTNVGKGGDSNNNTTNQNNFANKKNVSKQFT